MNIKQKINNLLTCPIEGIPIKNELNKKNVLVSYMQNQEIEEITKFSFSNPTFANIKFIELYSIKYSQSLKIPVIINEKNEQEEIVSAQCMCLRVDYIVFPNKIRGKKRCVGENVVVFIYRVKEGWQRKRGYRGYCTILFLCQLYKFSHRLSSISVPRHLGSSRCFASCR